jgi:hypothetical protein
MVHTAVVLISASHDRLCKGGSRAVSPHFIYSPFVLQKLIDINSDFSPKTCAVEINILYLSLFCFDAYDIIVS